MLRANPDAGRAPVGCRSGAGRAPVGRRSGAGRAPVRCRRAYGVDSGYPQYKTDESDVNPDRYLSREM